MKDTKTASLKGLRALKERGEISSPRPDVATLDMPEGFWDSAKPQTPKTKKQVNMRVDPDILEFFKGQGSGHLTRMHAVLRLYVDAQKKRHNASS